MKRIALFMTLALSLLAAPLALSASTSSYSGTFKPSGTLTFKIVKGKHGSKLTKFGFLHVPVTCNGGETTASANQIDTSPVKNGKFDEQLHSTDPQDNVRITFKGELSDGARKASGTMHLKGPKVQTDVGRKNNCDTGLLHWDAARS